MNTIVAGSGGAACRAGGWIALALALALLGVIHATQAAQQEVDAAPPLVVVLEVDGPIGPATQGYVGDELAAAESRGAALVVLRMDTPGGLSESMREIIHVILQSRVPVATYVAPRGARAASAGTYILYASHVAAMAPGTTLGAATPVQLGGGSTPLPGRERPAGTPGQEGEEEGAGQDEGTGTAPADAMTAKVVNDAVAYIRALAELRGRNAQWAERAVREAATLTSAQALEMNVIDLRVEPVEALVAEVDGRTVEVDREPLTLALTDARIEVVPPDWRDELLAVLTNPNIAFILMMLGIYGLIFELSNPGAIVPGVLGAICLMVGLYALNVLPVNYAGLALLLLGVALMTAEAFAPSFGALGLGGLAAFALGATILFDMDAPAFALSYWTVGTVTALTGVILVLLIGYVVKAHRRPVSTGEQTHVGALAEVESWSHGRGRVLLDGELWNATGPSRLRKGQQVRVARVNGLHLTVSAVDTAAPGKERTGELR